MSARRPAVLALLVVAALGVAGCGSDSGNAPEANSTPTGPATTNGRSCTYTTDGQSPAKDVSPPPSQAARSGIVDATMDTSVGTLRLRLNADQAPCTVNSFVSLATQGYFDDTSCHRLTTAQSGIFVLQCGDPTGTGSGGPGYSFPDELTGKERYTAGTLAMANGGPDTNGSQFFIVYEKTRLPPAYTVFGSVDAAGLRAVRKVARNGTDNAYGPGDGHPKTPVRITGVKIG